jgi:hypothetical protein
MSDFINLDHIITYNDPLLCEKFNILDEKEDEQLHDIIYQYDLLRIFDLEDFLEDIINEKIKNLYNIMIKNDDVQVICSSLYKKNIVSDNNEYYESFIILFSYDYLHLFYPCICEFIIHGNINKNKQLLFQNIF